MVCVNVVYVVVGVIVVGQVICVGVGVLFVWFVAGVIVCVSLDDLLGCCWMLKLLLLLWLLLPVWLLCGSVRTVFFLVCV